MVFLGYLFFLFSSLLFSSFRSFFSLFFTSPLLFARLCIKSEDYFMLYSFWFVESIWRNENTQNTTNSFSYRSFKVFLSLALQMDDDWMKHVQDWSQNYFLGARNRRILLCLAKEILSHFVFLNKTLNYKTIFIGTATKVNNYDWEKRHFLLLLL